jgi:ATP-dependent RNA helicase DeaD
MTTSTDPDPSEDDPNTFEPLGLSPALLENIGQLGFREPTPIQAAAIPPLLEGRDMIGRARTGSGKTAAFGLPLIQLLDRQHRGVQALILAPTRELALQVTEALRTFAQRGGPPIVTIYGGSPYGPQLKALREGVPIVVGTPGRVIDHLERGSLDLSGLRMLILDEADEMLRMGFIEDVEKVLEAASPERQVALFSATMPEPIRRVAAKHLKDPAIIQVEGGPLTVDHIEQRWIRVPERHKLEALVRILAAEDRGATLVFARTRAACAGLASELERRGIGVDALHGDLGQTARERVLGRMREGMLDVLIATDVASRGLDVEHITHVINFDLPTDAENYVHRIGRTGRAGREGNAISFVTPQQIGRLKGFSRRIGHPIPEAPVPSNAEMAQLRQKRLLEGLRGALKAEGQEPLRGWIETVAEEEGWDPLDMAAAAVRLLTEPRGALEFDPDPRPPVWARPPVRQQRPYSNDRRDGPPMNRGSNERHPGPPHDRGPSEHRQGRPGPNERSHGPPRNHPEVDPTDVVELFFAAGGARGLRPADVVGALANEAGVPGAWIGRITILDHKTFVGLPRVVAEHLAAAGPTFNLRGSDVRVALAREDGPKRRPDGGGRSAFGPHRSKDARTHVKRAKGRKGS